MSSSVGIYASQISGHLVTNSYASIATVTVGSGGSSSISFTSIPSTYTHLQVRMLSITPYDINFRFNSDSGSNYYYHYMYGAGSTPVASASGSLQTVGYAAYGGFGGNLVAVMDILDYTNTNKNKVTRSLSGSDNNTTGGVMLASTNWNSTSAINSITITAQGNNFAQYSSFALYGIR